MNRFGSLSLASLLTVAGSLCAQDQDQDGVEDARDNCPMTANAEQRDADEDSVGDACDNCPDTPNPGQELTGDGRPAACTANPGINMTDLVLHMVEVSLDAGTGTFDLKNDTGEPRGVTIESIEALWESIGREGVRTEGMVATSMFQATDKEGNMTTLEAETIVPAGAEWTVNYMVSIDPPAPEGTREIKHRVLIRLVGRDHVFRGSGSHRIPHEEGEGEEEPGGEPGDGEQVLLEVTAEPFLRGDVSNDGHVSITDPIGILGNLFGNGVLDVACADTEDANDDGVVDISDGIYLLLHLFAGSAAPPAPYYATGLDPTPDFLWCSR